MWMATGNILLFLIRLVFIRLSLMICALFCMYTELPKKKKREEVLRRKCQIRFLDRREVVNGLIIFK